MNVTELIQRFLIPYIEYVLSIFGGIILLLLLLLAISAFKRKRLEKVVAARTQETTNAKLEADAARARFEARVISIHNEAQEAIKNGQRQIDLQMTAIKQEEEHIRKHYEAEARRVQAEADEAINKLNEELEPLRKFQTLCGDGVDVQHVLTEAMQEATALRTQARLLIEQARAADAEERSKASQKAKEINQHADALLQRATCDAARIIDEAHTKAQKIGGDAYTALREKEQLEQALIAIRNVIEGYGDRYIIPTRSLIDDLAADFGHTEAGQTLAGAREQSRRMVETGLAAACDYVEDNRRETAIRFVIDAFNGRVDGILTRTKHDNFGVLEQEIRDTFALVNLNGKAFREARILPAYLDVRLAELKWAVVVQELKMKEREEQRRIKEQMREEEKARREYESAMQEAQKEEEIIKKAIEKARFDSEKASAEQKAQYETQLAELSRQLAEAEAKNQKALSMAQQTRKGNVYIISNIGSFGEDVFKIGMTRRLEPMERVKELGDASVPFEFDIHAMISSDDAPALENLLHTEFENFRINQVNYRKEFFQIPIDKIRSFLAEKGIQASFTMLAEAHEYRETKALSKMTPEAREKYHLCDKSEEEGMAD